MRILFLLIILAVSITAFGQTTVIGKVISVYDGDTITVLDAQYKQHKIRFADIDAPEIKQAFGTTNQSRISHG